MPIASLGTPVAEVNAAKGDGRPGESGPGLPSEFFSKKRLTLGLQAGSRR